MMEEETIHHDVADKKEIGNENDSDVEGNI